MRKVGDFVKILRPPHREAVRRGRKAKHIGTWCGPMRIVARPSASKFVVVYQYDGPVVTSATSRMSALGGAVFRRRRRSPTGASAKLCWKSVNFRSACT